MLTSFFDPQLNSFQVGLYDNQSGSGGSGAVQSFSNFSVTGLAAPGPIPGAGPLSYLALGILGVGSAAWKRLRRRQPKLAIA
jgi:hypothetical protein